MSLTYTHSENNLISTRTFNSQVFIALRQMNNFLDRHFKFKNRTFYFFSQIVHSCQREKARRQCDMDGLSFSSRRPSIQVVGSRRPVPRQWVGFIIIAFAIVSIVSIDEIIDLCCIMKIVEFSYRLFGFSIIWYWK